MNTGAEKVKLLIFRLPYGRNTLLKVEKAVALGAHVRELLGGDRSCPRRAEDSSEGKEACGEELHDSGGVLGARTRRA